MNNGVKYQIFISTICFLKNMSFFRFSHLLLVIKLIFSTSGIVKLIHNWKLTFRILSWHCFAFVYEIHYENLSFIKGEYNNSM